MLWKEENHLIKKILIHIEATVAIAIGVENQDILLEIVVMTIKEIMKNKKLRFQKNKEPGNLLNKVNKDKDIKKTNIELGLEIKRQHQKRKNINLQNQVQRQVRVLSLVHIPVQVRRVLTESVDTKGEIIRK